MTKYIRCKHCGSILKATPVTASTVSTRKSNKKNVKLKEHSVLSAKVFPDKDGKVVLSDDNLLLVKDTMDAWLSKYISDAAEMKGEPEEDDDGRKDMFFGRTRGNDAIPNSKIPGGELLDEFDMYYDDGTITMEFYDPDPESLQLLLDGIKKRKSLYFVDNGYYGSVSTKGVLDWDWSGVSRILKMLERDLEVTGISGGKYSFDVVSVSSSDDTISVNVKLSYLEVWIDPDSAPSDDDDDDWDEG